jgi:hypothetical protein
VYRKALKLLIQDTPVPESIPEPVERAAKALYGLLHQRYVLSPRGLDMLRRLLVLPTNNPGGVCRGMPLLPIGDSDEFHTDGAAEDAATISDEDASTMGALVEEANRRAKRYCACCRRVYFHWDSKVDGCAWGLSLSHLFLMVYLDEVFVEWKEHRQSIPLLNKI